VLKSITNFTELFYSVCSKCPPFQWRSRTFGRPGR